MVENKQKKPPITLWWANYRSSYKWNDGTVIPATVEYDAFKKGDTTMTITPNVKNGTTHIVTLNGPKSKVLTATTNDGFVEEKEYDKEWIDYARQANKNRSDKHKLLEFWDDIVGYWNIIANKIGFKQQGGTINPQEQITQLVLAAMQGDPEANNFIKQIMQAAQQGDRNAALLAQMIQEIVSQMKGVKAKLGAKLDYINILKNGCPEGTEKVYLKKGGCMCKKKIKESKCGSKIKK